ncbi:hypothetical protein SAMN05421771_0119 [Granulicella pectinivorans]|uniref:Uncharacterized protein n=1 Tax=Granulicella pectinivorans TaxID=474950 RepID=A0A1I6L1J9_9BACT|nr:hypothetical protein [Granulicella pectinivorans]SFR97335.1 hypothetical protein SAMN05421771_0119 [Granulicella pectinivorans]
MNAKTTTTRSLWALALLVSTPVFAQLPAAPEETPRLVLTIASASDGHVHAASEATVSGPSDSSSLPDAPLPGTGMLHAYDWTLPAPPPVLPPCPKQRTLDTAPCLINPYRRFLDSTTPTPLTVGQKGYLAVHNFLDPGNIVTIVGTAAFTVGVNPHTAYGPGFAGFGWNTAYSFSQDATGEFFGTFLIPSIFHEDPHYHREPHAPVAHRIVHALARTLIAQSDTGRMMPNYAVLMTYPISAETSNLYVPGIAGNGPSTVKRIATGLATDPVNNLITEFLPDVAKRVNIRVIFVQRLVNMMTAGNATGAAAMESGGSF